jgi:hypothetical protein
MQYHKVWRAVSITKQAGKNKVERCMTKASVEHHATQDG